MVSELCSHGHWQSLSTTPAFRMTDILHVAQRIGEPLFVVQDPSSGSLGVAIGGQTALSEPAHQTPRWPLLAVLPPLFPEWLGDRSFGEVHGVRFPYITGAMANGIATTRLVSSMARCGCIGFFGAAGLTPAEVEQAVVELHSTLGDALPWGCNLIHSPNDPALEEALVDLYLRLGVRRISAAAYMSLTPAVVRFALRGVRQDPTGRIIRGRHVLAKISRPEVARRFMEPAPTGILDQLVQRGLLSAEEGRLGRHVALAEDIIVEADSGGHTDNRPLGALFPGILALSEEIAQQRGYHYPLRVGAAGGLGTPSAVAAAFSLGAAFVLTGSVNQACLESGLHQSGRRLLDQAEIADVIMAPAADMFELGVEVQVLRRGTMFAVRARKLYDLYRSYSSLEDIPAAERSMIEKQLLKASFEEAWESTRSFWSERDPKEVSRAEGDPKHKMALVFRSYLGLSSRWAIEGDPDRCADYQIWCGPALGAFNRWTKGSFLARPEERSAVQVARNLMEGAAVITRLQQLRTCGLPIPAAGFDYRPRLLQ